MLQPDSTLPAVPMKPAPWDLEGQAWIVVLKLPADDPARSAFLPDRGIDTPAGRWSMLMFVDYAHSDCGPYHELLFVPGAQRFADGKRHLTISRILVSTWDSVVNGRVNWGIPKDRADFAVRYRVDGTREDHIRVTSDGELLAELRLRDFPLSLPVHGGLLPVAQRTLAQRLGGRTFLYAPSSRGWIRPGRLVDWRFNPALFPDLSGARVVAAVKVPSFRMGFPVANVLPVS